MRCALRAKESSDYAIDHYKVRCFNKLRRISLDNVLPSELTIAIIHQLEALYTRTSDGVSAGINAIEESLVNLHEFRR